MSGRPLFEAPRPGDIPVGVLRPDRPIRLAAACPPPVPIVRLEPLVPVGPFQNARRLSAARQSNRPRSALSAGPL